jgi:TPR repeat protein
VPGVVLDVVVGGELATVDASSLQNNDQDPKLKTLPQQPPSSTPRNPTYGPVEQAMENYNYMERPVTPQPTAQGFQANTTRDQQETNDQSPSPTQSQPIEGATNTQRSYAPQDPSITTSMNLMQTMVSANQGNADAQFALGDRYRNGDGVNRDCQEAMDWYLKAAEKNHAQAQFNIGVLHLQDPMFEKLICHDLVKDVTLQDYGDIPKDEDKALHWFLKAASQGFADAQFGLAVVKFNHRDNSDPESALVAVEWCREAANQDHGPAQAYMGEFYRCGFGLRKDGSLASEWSLKAVGRSGGYAEWILGCLYKEGFGVLQDELMAFGWFFRSAKQKSPLGQFALAKCYEEGKGVSANREKAIALYTKASQAGNQEAKNELERLQKPGGFFSHEHITSLIHQIQMSQQKSDAKINGIGFSALFSKQ